MVSSLIDVNELLAGIRKILRDEKLPEAKRRNIKVLRDGYLVYHGGNRVEVAFLMVVHHDSKHQAALKHLARILTRAYGPKRLVGTKGRFGYALAVTLP